MTETLWRGVITVEEEEVEEELEEEEEKEEERCRDSPGSRRKFQVIFTHGEDSQVCANNFNWSSEVSAVQLIKLPQRNFKSRTESGEKFNLKKFTQASQYIHIRSELTQEMPQELYDLLSDVSGPRLIGYIRPEDKTKTPLVVAAREKQLLGFCVSLPSIKRENHYFLDQDFLPELHQDSLLLYEYFNSKLMQSSSIKKPGELNVNEDHDVPEEKNKESANDPGSVGEDAALGDEVATPDNVPVLGDEDAPPANVPGPVDEDAPPANVPGPVDEDAPPANVPLLGEEDAPPLVNMNNSESDKPGTPPPPPPSEWIPATVPETVPEPEKQVPLIPKLRVRKDILRDDPVDVIDVEAQAAGSQADDALRLLRDCRYLFGEQPPPSIVEHHRPQILGVSPPQPQSIMMPKSRFLILPPRNQNDLLRPRTPLQPEGPRPQPPRGQTAKLNAVPYRVIKKHNRIQLRPSLRGGGSVQIQRPHPPNRTISQPTGKSTANLILEETLSSLSERDRHVFHLMKVFFTEILSKGTQEMKKKAKLFLEGCDQSLLQLFKENGAYFPHDAGIIEIFRKFYRAQKNLLQVPSVPSCINLELEENVIIRFSEYLAKEALVAVQSFFDSLPSHLHAYLMQMTLELLKTNIGVKTFCDRTGFSFTANSTKVSGRGAVEFLSRNFPHLREAIVIKRFKLSSIHTIFSIVHLNVKRLNVEDFDIELAKHFELKMKGLIRNTDVFFNLLMSLMLKTDSLLEFIQFNPHITEREKLIKSFHHFMIGVRNGKISVSQTRPLKSSASTSRAPEGADADTTTQSSNSSQGDPSPVSGEQFKVATSAKVPERCEDIPEVPIMVEATQSSSSSQRDSSPVSGEHEKVADKQEIAKAPERSEERTETTQPISSNPGDPSPVSGEQEKDLTSAEIPERCEEISVKLDFQLHAEWIVESFDRRRVLSVLFTSDHLLFVPPHHLTPSTEFLSGFEFPNTFSSGPTKSGKIWFDQQKSKEFCFQKLETLDDFVDLFLNKHGITEEILLVERGIFQELSFSYEKASSSEYKVTPTIIQPAEERENLSNLCFLLLKDTFGIPMRMEFKGFIYLEHTNNVIIINVKFFGLLLSDFLVIFPTERESRYFRDSLYVGEEIQVKVCQVNQRRKLKLIFPLISADQPEELRGRISHLRHAIIVSPGEVSLVKESQPVAIPRSDWKQFFQVLDTSTNIKVKVHPGQVTRLKLQLESVAKFQLHKFKSSYHAFYFVQKPSEEDDVPAKSAEISDILKLNVCVVPCKENEENPVDVYDISAGVYIEKLPKDLFAVSFTIKGGQGGSRPSFKTEKLRLIKKIPHIYQAHVWGEALVTDVESLTEAISQRVTDWRSLYGERGLQYFHPSFAKFIQNYKQQTMSTSKKVNSPKSIKKMKPDLLKKDIKEEIDISIANISQLVEIPGVDEEVANLIVRARKASNTAVEFVRNNLSTLFSKEDGIQFDVGVLGRNGLKLAFNGEPLDKDLVEKITIEDDLKRKEEIRSVSLNGEVQENPSGNSLESVPTDGEPMDLDPQTENEVDHSPGAASEIRGSDTDREKETVGDVREEREDMNVELTDRQSTDRETDLDNTVREDREPIVEEREDIPDDADEFTVRQSIEGQSTDKGDEGTSEEIVEAAKQTNDTVADNLEEDLRTENENIPQDSEVEGPDSNNTNLPRPVSGDDLLSDRPEEEVARSVPLEDITERIASNLSGENLNNSDNSSENNNAVSMSTSEKVKMKKRKNIENKKHCGEEIEPQVKRKRSRRNSIKQIQPRSQRSRRSKRVKISLQTEPPIISDSHPKLNNTSVQSELTPAGVGDHQSSETENGSKQKAEAKRKKKKTKRVEVLTFERNTENEAENKARHASSIWKLNQRLFSGQYVRLTKLSRELIEKRIGCSLREYLHEKGKVTLSEALRGDSYPGVRLTAAEEELLSLSLTREPISPPQHKLTCAFCQEEFGDYKARVKHYLKHTQGDLITPQTTASFPCALCPVQLDSVEERRQHYELLHCSSTETSVQSRVSCRQKTCTMDFESEAEMLNHFLRSHKLKSFPHPLPSFQD